MSLRSREASTGVTPLRDAMNRLFEESFISPHLDVFTSRTFALDVYETPEGQQYVVEAALPGCKPEEITITAEGNTIVIRTDSKEEEKTEKGSYVRREVYLGEMTRSVTLPTPIDASKVEASYEHGILTLRIPKPASVQPKQIPVKVKEPAKA